MSRSPDTILFDLGNTLVGYYELADFPGILKNAIAGVESSLQAHGNMAMAEQELARNVAAENHEASDYSVRPLEERLGRIFGFDATDTEIADMACRAFMEPIFSLAHLYSDVLPALHQLRSSGYRIGIVSNTPWGSPASLWLEETERLGLNRHTDAVIFCRDAGWRKPARQIFEHALLRLNTSPERSVFVGDDPRWDVAGPENIGMRPILLDRTGRVTNTCTTIRSLDELHDILLREPQE